MPTRKFKFVSPGIFLDEVDNSQLPATPRDIGPVIIGRTERGPAMKPVQVDSFSDFVEVFGYPVPGGAGGDVWREGNRMSPTYASYAAQAYLKNNSPVTIVRTLGCQHDNASADGRAGWSVGTLGAAHHSLGGDGGAYGLWIFPSGTAAMDGTLAAVWYLQTGSILLSGSGRGSEGDAHHTEGAATMITSTGSHQEFVARIRSTGDNEIHKTSFNFNPNSNRFIRKVFNTNPTLMNANITTGENQQTYFLGETYERAVSDMFAASGSEGDRVFGVILGLREYDGSGTAYNMRSYPTRPSKTGWFLSQDRRSVVEGEVNNYNPTNSGMSTKLFRFISLETGEWDQQNIKISIQDIKASTNSYDNYGTFTVAIRKINDSDNAPRVIERFVGCNLNPNSPDYVARKIGDKYKTWDDAERIHREYGNFDNMSKFIRVEMNPSVDNGSVEDTLLPFGVIGPPKFNDWRWAQNEGAGSADLGPHHPLDSTSYSSERAELAPALDFTGVQAAGAAANICSFVVNVPTAAGGEGPITIQMGTAVELAAAGVTATNGLIVIDRDAAAPADDDAVENFFRAAINGTADAAISYPAVGSGSSGVTALVAAENGVDTEKIDLTAFNEGTAGNSITLTDAGGTIDAVGVLGPALAGGSGQVFLGAYAAGSGSIAGLPSYLNPGILMYAGTSSFSGTFTYPEVPLRRTSADGNLPKPSLCYWGASTTKVSSSVYDTSIPDLVRAKAGAGSDSSYDDAAMGTATTDTLVPMWVFTLHDLTGTLATNSTTRYESARHTSGSYAAGSSIAANSSDGYRAVLNAGFNRFTTLLHGGTDGLNIVEQEPYANRVLGANTNEVDNYAFYTVKRAIDTIRDPEEIEFNLATIPGVTQPGLTQHLVRMCEDRSDALAIIDLENDYLPASENSDGDENNRGNVDLAISELRNREINSSYACCYYPWVQIRDTTTGHRVWLPPSVAALGTMGHAERTSEVWFAPAGYTRGNLTEAHSGLPVVGVKQRLTSKDRDKLYAAHINPIASFADRGIVVFGQKTLQVTESALDRINVRRLMIHVKKEISRMAATILFDQNVQTTWNGFLGRVEPFLRSVKSRLGLTDFKVILDETTTTPDLIDRNILYAKVFLKPAKAIEFIAIDFVITDSGASFED